MRLADAKKWPADTHLFDIGGCNIPLLWQDSRIQAVLCGSILKIIGDILFENAFPDGDERTQMSRDAVVYAGSVLPG